MPRQLRVLLVFPYGMAGGAERWLLRVVSATDRVQSKALVLAPTGPLFVELQRSGIAVSTLDVGRHPAAIAAAWARAVPGLRSADVDVVLANGTKAAAVAVPAARAAGTPVVWAKHDHSWDRQLARPLGRLSDAVIATAATVAVGTGRDDAHILPFPASAVEPATREDAAAFWRARGIETDRLTAVMVGRLVPYKGVEDALRALIDAPNWDLVVVGEDDHSTPGEAARLRAIARAVGVDSRVSFAGHVTDAHRWLAAFDALAMLTRPTSRLPGGEGFGATVMEAMRAGVPVICVDGGPAAERVRVGAGITVPPGSPSEVAAALRAFEDPTAREHAGRVGRKSTSEHPRDHEVAEALVDVLAETARRPGAGRRGGPAISVVTTVLDEAASVGRLVAEVTRQLRSDDEFVIVDGGSRDGTLDVLEAASASEPRIVVLRRPGANIPAGRNAAIGAARHDVIACTDAGCSPVDGWLAAFRGAFAAERRPALVTGVYEVVANGPFQEAIAATAYPDPAEAVAETPFVRAYGRIFGRTFDPSLPTGRSCAFTRDAWGAVGGFPEHLVAAEDVRFGRAIADAGGRCQLHVDALVRWEERPTATSTALMFHRYGIGDGRSGDPTLVGRNIARLCAYLAGAAALTCGGRRTRTLAIGGAAVYLSLPLLRVRRRRLGLRVAALVPPAAVLRDVAKVSGCLRGSWERWSERPVVGERPPPRHVGPTGDEQSRSRRR